MREPVVLCGLVLWAGMTLVLADLRWFRRPRLVVRLREHVPGARAARLVAGAWSVESFRDVVAPLARTVGEGVARVFGIGEDLSLRLQRIHSPIDASAFRVRQLGWAIAALATAIAAGAALSLPPLVAIGLAAGAPLLVFLLLEQRVASTSAAWQRRIFLELPVVSEQLAMLLNAGYSLGAALNRLAGRGRGACARDLAIVCGRVRQGLTEAQALTEWAAVAKVDALQNLLPVLARAGEASDLGRLLSTEARGIRQDVQRELVVSMGRRAQQVWIPVTVATLVPGVIFLSIPFIEALRRFSGA